MTRPAVVLLHEWWGLTSPKSNLDTLAQRFESLGFAVRGVDLYEGKIACTPQKAKKLVEATEWEKSKAVIQKNVDELRARGHAKIFVIGFSMGGSRALKSAYEVSGVSGAVVFYGGLALPTDPTQLKVPVQFHFSQKDEFMPIEKLKEFERRYTENTNLATFYYYDAEHSFMNEKLPSKFSQEATDLAWGRMLSFLGG